MLGRRSVPRDRVRDLPQRIYGRSGILPEDAGPVRRGTWSAGRCTRARDGLRGAQGETAMRAGAALGQIGLVVRGPGCPVAESLVEPDARLSGDSYRSGLRSVAVLAPVLGSRDRAVLLGEVAVERRLFLQVGGKLLGGHQPEEDRTENGLQSQRVVHLDIGEPAAYFLDTGFGGTVGLAAARAFGVELDGAVGFKLA